MTYFWDIEACPLLFGVSVITGLVCLGKSYCGRPNPIMGDLVLSQKNQKTGKEFNLANNSVYGHWPETWHEYDLLESFETDKTE